MLLPKRIWKDIPGFEGKYQVSNTGQVRSLNYKRTGKTKILKQNTTKRGYKQVTLCKKGEKPYPYYVHRLVAQAFIQNPNNLPEVNHKDENKANNAVWNLEWCDRLYNNEYGTARQRMSKSKIGQHTGGDNGNSKKVKCIELDLIFNSVADANEYLDKPRQNDNIRACARGEQKTAWEYHWIYIEK